MKKKIFLFVALSSLGIVVLARDALLTKGVEVYISRKMVTQGWSIGEIQRDKNTLVLTNLSYQSPSANLVIEDAFVAFHLTLFPLRLEPDVKISRTLVEVFPGSSSDSSILGAVFCLADPRLDLKLSIDEGEVRGVLEKPFAFSFKPGTEKREIGTLSMGDAESNVFLSTHLQWDRKALVSKLEIEEGHVQDLMALASFMQIDALQGWSEGQGKVSASLQSRFHPRKGLEKMEGKMDLAEVAFSHPGLGINLLSKSIQGTLLYAPKKEKKKPLPFWKEVELFLTFEETNLRMEKQGASIEEVLGEMRLVPQEDPYLKLNGKMLSKGKSVPFEIEGKGQLLEGQNFWLQASAHFFQSKSEPHLFVSYSQKGHDESFVQVECMEMTEGVFNVLALSLPFLKVPECSMLKGEFAGKFEGTLKGGLLKKLSFSEVQSGGLSVSVPSKQLSIQTHGFNSSGTWERDKFGALACTALKATLSNVDVEVNGKESLRAFSSEIQVQNGELISSYAEGFYEGMWASVRIEDLPSQNFAHIECSALSSDLMQKIWKEKQIAAKGSPITLALDVLNQGGKALGTATLKLLSGTGVEEEIDLQLSLNQEISRQIKDLMRGVDLSSLRGFFHTEKLSTETSKLWLKPWLDGFAFEGFLKGEGEFNTKKLSLKLSEVNLHVADRSLDVRAKLGADGKEILASYEYAENLWKGSIPIDGLLARSKQMQMDAKLQNTVLFFEGDQLWTDHMEVEALGVNVLATLLVDSAGVHVASKAFDGDIATLTPILSRFAPQLSAWDLKGAFAVEERECLVEGKKLDSKWSWDWKSSVHLKDVACNLGKAGKVQQAKMRLDAKASGDFACRGLMGLYTLGSTSCPFALSDLQFSATSSVPIDFSLLAKDGKREWLHVQGTFEKQKGGTLISLAPHSHVFGVVMDVSPFMINDKFAISPLKVTSTLKLEQLPAYVSMWKDMGVTMPQTSFFEGYAGALQVQGLYDVGSASWKAAFKSNEIKAKENVIGKAAGVISNDGKQIKIESCQIGPWSIKGFLEKLPGEWNIPMLAVEWTDGKCQIKGKYILSSNKMQISSFSGSLNTKELGSMQLQGSFEGSYFPETSAFLGRGSSSLINVLPAAWGLAVESTKDISFIIDSNRGLQIEKSQWELTSFSRQKLGKISTKTLTYSKDDKRFLMQNVSLSLGKDAYKTLQRLPLLIDVLKDVEIDQAIDLVADLDFTKDSRKATATLSNGKYKIKDTTLEFKQTKLQLDQDDLFISSQTKWQDESLLLQFQMKLKGAFTGSLTIKEQPEHKGLALQFKKTPKEGLFCDSIQGTFKGIALQMQKEAGKSLYNVQVKADLSQVSSLLPKAKATAMKKWGLGQGYVFQGVVAVDPAKPFQIYSLKGDLSGENFEFLGKNFHSLSAKIEWNKEKGRIHTVKLEDDLAHLSIKTVDLAFNQVSKAWEVSSPLVSVKDFAPALFLKGRKERGVEIKNLSLYDLKGALNNLDSFEAKGGLYFTSVERKEFSFWDVPLGLMKDWGLDPGLLTPVIGEAEFVLRHGNFYFTALRNVFSDGQRSQFYLAEGADASYLSLDGTWHVDLSMKQNVVWKVTEDLILSIRGTVEKPKYSFKSNKNSR